MVSSSLEYSIGKAVLVIAEILGSDIPNNSTSELFTSALIISLCGVLTSEKPQLCNRDCIMQSPLIGWLVKLDVSDKPKFIGSGVSNSWFVFIILYNIMNIIT